MLTDTQVREIRSRFSIFKHKIYLNSCSQGPLSDAVQAGLEDFIASWHEQGSPWETWVNRYEAARTAFAQFINAGPDEVAIVTSVSAGINGVASALNFRERKKVVMGEFEFPTMGHVWLGHRVRGAEVHFVKAEGNCIPTVNYETIVDRNTLIVPVTRVCFKNGFRSEVNTITQIAHRVGAFVMLDDYQDCGTRPVDVKALDLDFFVTGTLKYLLGPPGLAFMYVRKELIPSLVPTVTGWFAQANPFAYDPQTFDLSPTARRFESGSPSVPNVYAALPGFQLLQEIGLEKVAAHIKTLAQSLFLNPWAGFSVRATYGVAQIIAIGAEVTAAGIYISRWFPNVPQWIWVVLVSAALVALNSMKVNRLGEFEYWFATIKVAAIVAFIIVGISLILGVGSGRALGFANLTQHGGFLPAGWKGVWLSLTITVTSYMGVEIIAVTAGEAEHPEVTIPRAMRSIVWRLILFYVLAIAIMVTMVPWNQIGASSTVSGSPFVTAFAAAHIPFAAAIMNFVVLTAALSSVNTNLYLSTRMLFSLGQGGYAPQWMGTVSRNGVPHRALLASTAGIIAAILLAIFAPRNAFLMLYGTAVAGMLFVWLVILNTHLRFRKAITHERLLTLPMRLSAHPLFTVVGILLLLAISVTTFFVDGLQWSVPVFSVFLGLISLLYLHGRRRKTI